MNIAGPLSFISGFAVAALAGWVGLPAVLYETQAQPAQFSHVAHKDKASMGCADCHGFRDDGSFAGIPKLESCVGCHAEPSGTTSSEKAFVDKFVKPSLEPNWLVYSRQPVNVRFPHAVHVNAGKMQCEECHGAHGTTQSLRPYQQNRISGYSRDIWGSNLLRVNLPAAEGMKMSDCEDCHAKKNVHAGCLGCHR